MREPDLAREAPKEREERQGNREREREREMKSKCVYCLGDGMHKSWHIHPS